MATGRGNLQSGLEGWAGAAATEELVEVLAEGRAVRIERIVSDGHASPEGFWYDQDEAEWVLVVRGAARLRLEGPEDVVELAAGDWVTIEPHRRHRVEWTRPGEETVWLAVFWKDDAPGA
jgi:cupin 2 domain-containing protein